MHALARCARVGLLTRCAAGVLALAAVSFADPLNGNFEAGSLNNWIQGGDGGKVLVSASSPGDIAPISGSHSGLVHNGFDDSGFTGILTSAPIIVSMYGGTLSFKYNFLTAEFTGAFAEQLDFFEVWLDDVLAPANNTRLLYGDVSGADGGGASAYTFDFILPLDADGFEQAASAPDGSSYYEETGVQSYSTALTQGSYRLRFLVQDGEDDVFTSLFDSALLIDDVFFAANQPPPAPTPIPEPSTFALLALGGLAALVARRRRR